MNNYETILITGGAGFVGSNLAVKLKSDNPDKRVIALDNLKRRGSELNIPRLKRSGVEFVHGDIRNREDIEAVGHFDLLIECSAEPSVLAGYNESPEYLIKTNLFGTANCLEVLRKYRADIIFLSTSRVYPIRAINSLNFIELETRFDLASEQKIKGVSPDGIAEDFTLNGVRSLYGMTKLASELLIQEYIEAYNIKGVINRCGVLTGPWQMGKVDQGVVVLWVAKHIFKGALSYIGFGGKGKQVRDILHIDDLYRLLCLQADDMSGCNGRVYNVGGGRQISISLQELTKICQKVTGNKIQISSVTENRVADIPWYVTDFSLVQKETGWSPTLEVEKIVSDIYQWILQNEQMLKLIFA